MYALYDNRLLKIKKEKEKSCVVIFDHPRSSIWVKYTLDFQNFLSNLKNRIENKLVKKYPQS